MIWSFILAAIGILGIYVAGQNNKWGWAIGLSAQVLWVAYAVVTQQYGFILSAAAYAYFYGLNFYKWHRRSQHE